MSAFSEAQKLYDGDDLLNIMAYCAHNGIVYADKECFLCAYPTHSSLIETESKYRLRRAIETEYKKGVHNPDTWYVYIAAGNLKELMSLAEPMKYICYERFDKKIRLIEWRRLWAKE